MPECFNCAKQVRQATLDQNLLLQSYFDEAGNLLKEVFIDVPQKIAVDFYNQGLKIKQLRDFHSRIAFANKKSLLKGIDAARSLLWECRTHLEYQLKRNVIPESFAEFVRNHIELAEKNEKNLEGFYEHLNSIVCFFPKERGGL